MVTTFHSWTIVSEENACEHHRLDQFAPVGLCCCVAVAAAVIVVISKLYQRYPTSVFHLVCWFLLLCESVLTSAFLSFSVVLKLCWFVCVCLFVHCTLWVDELWTKLMQWRLIFPVFNALFVFYHFVSLFMLTCLWLFEWLVLNCSAELVNCLLTSFILFLCLFVCFLLILLQFLVAVHISHFMLATQCGKMM